jgi:hypothetical protein
MNRFCSLKLFILLVILTSVNCAIAQTTTTFGYTGAVQTYTVPAGVTKIYVDAIGGRGGMNYYYSRPGYGGRVQCALTVTPGQVLNIYVGGRGAGTGYTSPVCCIYYAGGYNGGGQGYYYGGGGGGATDIRIGGTALTDRKVVAGGGGGAGYNYSTFNYDRGGDGGGVTGEKGFGAGNNTGTQGGGGGTSSAGGGAATYSCVNAAGALGIGGNVSTTCYSGGGGGGYYGGGAGSYGGGGGGSSYTDAVLASNVTHTQGANETGDGQVTIATMTPGSVVFGYNGGSQTFTVPAGVSYVYVDAVGAMGGSNVYWPNNSYASQGGFGARVQGVLAVTEGQVLTVNVGGRGGDGYMVSSSYNAGIGGYNGGGNAGLSSPYTGGAGGGASDIRVGGSGLGNRVIVAAGGGGAGNNSYTGNKDKGGDGGTLIGENGYSNGANTSTSVGFGGTQSAGGANGSGGGTAGSLGSGGAAYSSGGCGGGGGGYYGGGGSGTSWTGGGGGSSYNDAATTSSVAHTRGYNYSAHGSVVIVPLVPTVITGPTAIAFGSVTTLTSSSSQIFSMTGSYLTSAGTFTVTAPSSFQVSSNGTTWSSTITIPYTGITLTATTVYVRFNPTALTAYTGDITITGGGLQADATVTLTGTGSNACSAVPTAGTAGATPSSGTSSTSFALSLSGGSTGGGLTYQWQSSPDNSTWTNIFGATTSGYTFTGLTANTYYRCVSTCPSFGTANSTSTLVTFAFPGLPCTPTCANVSGVCPNAFVVATTGYPFVLNGENSTSINDATACSSSQVYFNLTTTTNVTLHPGKAYSATHGKNNGYINSSQIWIDFNNSGTFDANETVGGTQIWGTLTNNSPVVIPSTVAPGAYRMRAIVVYNSGSSGSTSYPNYPNIPSCPTTTVQYAEARDYKVTIVSPVSVSASSLAFPNVAPGSSSIPPLAVALTATNLSSAIGTYVATAPSGYYLSTDGNTWGTTTIIPYSGGSLGTKNIYVQFAPTLATTYSGNITIAGPGIPTTLNVAVSGTGNATLCSGTPAAGTAAVSPTSGNATTAFTVSLSGGTAASGLVYQWQASTDGGSTWNNLPGGIAPTYSFKGIGATTVYRCNVGCGAGTTATSGTATASFTFPSISCTPICNYYTSVCSGSYPTVASSGYPFSMTGASGTSITDATNCSTSATYMDVSGTYSVAVNTGSSYTATYGRNTGGYTSSSQIWIDFNGDGSFQQYETVGGSLATWYTTTTTSTITIPAWALPGTYRMRVITAYNGGNTNNLNYPAYPYIPSCPTNSGSYIQYYTDARDYKVVVLNACAGTPDVGITSGTPTVACAAYSANLFNVGVAGTAGISYQWQSSTNPTSGFTNVAGATNTRYTPAVSATRYYRNLVTCANGGSATSSNQQLQLNAPPVAISGTTTVCISGTSSLTNATGGGTWLSTNTTAATIGSATGVVTGLASGTTTISYIMPGASCYTTTIVTVNARPTMGSIISIPSSLCAGNLLSFIAAGESGTGTPTSYNWSGPNGYSATTSLNEAAFTPNTSAASGVYSVSVTYPGAGCTSNAGVSTIVTVNALPALYNVTGGGVYCQGGTGIAVGLNIGVAGINYQLYNGASAVGGLVAGTGGALTFGSQTAAGTYTAVAINATTLCTVNMTGSAVVSINPAPAAYAVNGGGSYCSGGAGLAIGLDNSALGMIYRLYNGGTPVGGNIAGTGTPITFGNQTAAGTYTVLATNTTTGCTAAMTGSTPIAINALPAPFVVSGGGGYCAGGTGASIQLSGSTTGVSYQLYAGAAIPTTTIGGTGSLLNFNGVTTAGTYSVIATNSTTNCASQMTGTATVGINSVPSVYTVNGGGVNCSSGTGVHVGMNNSNVGIDYKLYNGSTQVGLVPGNGGSLDFGLQTVGGTYTVQAVNASTSCSSNMAGSATITVYTSPGVYTTTGGGNYCIGTSGSTVNLNGSDAGINYQLYVGTTAVGSPVVGDGTPISFGGQTAIGTYSVRATNGATSCASNMLGYPTVGTNPAPVAYNVAGGGAYCAGGAGVHVALGWSASGITYKLYNGATLLSSTAGTGSMLDFGSQTAAGVYTVEATNDITNCSSAMTGGAFVSIYPSPALHAVNGGGSYCTGGAGMGVTLDGSNAGTNYQLFRNGISVGSYLMGTGSSLDFGMQTLNGTYAVVATTPANGCVAGMTNTVTVTVTTPPTVYAVSGGGAYCAGGTGVNIALGNSTTGVNYQLYNGTAPVGIPVGGTGGMLPLGTHTTAGTYVVVGTDATSLCPSNMSGSATVSINSLPVSYAMGANVSYCAGGAGANVTISNSATGISYQLYNGATAVGIPRAGTGGVMDFGTVPAGVYSAVGTSSAGCTNAMTGTTTVSINALPALYNVTGSAGSYCQGGTGVMISLDGSASGVTYYLFNGTTAAGSGVAGTGSVIGFGNHTAGSYVVLALDDATNCVRNMTGTANVTIDPLPTLFSVTGGGGYCNGGNGVNIGLNNSNVGTSYELYHAGTSTGTVVSGTGAAIGFGLHLSPGTYMVVATNSSSCTNDMSGTATVSVNSSPNAHTVTGGGVFCAGGAGVQVGLNVADAGISYQLYNGSTPSGAVVGGTDAVLDFGYRTAAGIYTVLATNTTTGCSKVMNGNATLTANAQPVAYAVTGGGAYCAGDAGVHIGLFNSTTGISYQLYNGGVAVGSPIAGSTGMPIDFGLTTVPGTYSVMATNTATTCANDMTGSVPVTINSVPNAYTVTGGGPYCSGGSGVHVGLDGSVVGIHYQLYLGGAPLGVPVTGSGTPLDFGVLAAGNYSVIATNPASGCFRDDERQRHKHDHSDRLPVCINNFGWRIVNMLRCDKYLYRDAR